MISSVDKLVVLAAFATVILFVVAVSTAATDKHPQVIAKLAQEAADRGKTGHANEIAANRYGVVEDDEEFEEDDDWQHGHDDPFDHDDDDLTGHRVANLMRRVNDVNYVDPNDAHMDEINWHENSEEALRHKINGTTTPADPTEPSVEESL